MKHTPTIQTIAWFRSRAIDGTLELRPPYQRRPVWTAKQRCYLIESILLKLPIPEIYIQQTTSSDGETLYAVVDGQQRVRTILQFLGAEKDKDEEEHNKFTLDMLGRESEWWGCSFDDLNEDRKRDFFGFDLAVRFLNTDNNLEVRDMFMRLNKFLTKLSNQELRNAIYTGPFVKLSNDLADDEYWIENRLVTPQLVRRMRDIEFISELFIGVMHGPQAGKASQVDEYYRRFEEYEDEFPGQRETRRLFRRTREKIELILPDIKLTRWKNRTDFYTLFVAVAGLLRNHILSPRKTKELREALVGFEEEINTRLADEKAKVSPLAIKYVRAVEKGANDKRRRADRHEALLEVIEEFFKKAKSK